MSAVLAVEALVGRETVPLGEFTVPADGELAVPVMCGRALATMVRGGGVYVISARSHDGRPLPWLHFDAERVVRLNEGDSLHVDILIAQDGPVAAEHPWELVVRRCQP